MTWCNPVEVLPRVSLNCTKEIPKTWNNTSLFVDPISYIIKSAALPTRCNDIDPAKVEHSRVVVLCIPLYQCVRSPKGTASEGGPD